MKNFEQAGFTQFMASPAGRIGRIVVGLGLMALAISQRSSKGKASLLTIGAIPLSAGAFDFCLISPLFNGPFWGEQIRGVKTESSERSRFLDVNAKKVFHTSQLN